MLNIFLYFLF